MSAAPTARQRLFVLVLVLALAVTPVAVLVWSLGLLEDAPHTPAITADSEK